MCPISGIFLLLASTCVFCHHVDIIDKTNLGIYGGTPIKITDVPFMALYAGCGAAIVAEQFVVTAGHCLDFNGTYVTVGTDSVLKGGTDYEIEKNILHPKFHIDDKSVKYDMAVIKLKEKLVFNEKINKINMADASMILNEGDMLETVGFGFTEHMNNSLNQLLSVKLPFVNQKECKKDYENYDQHITDTEICAGGEAGKGSCFGDSGGPLFYKGHLYGVTSWGKPCALKGYPTVFASVPITRDFIDGVIQKH
ncbi:hypothetical protein O0L34_g14591 [Tuta absoluta]|nr:hypothetical protein O0L34_g14591 [Tuta absoluta]